MRGPPARVSPLVAACVMAAGLLGGVSSAERGSRAAPAGEEERARVLQDYAQIPLSFEENRGQTDPRVRYLTRGKGYTLYLTREGAVFSLYGALSEPGALGPTPGPPGAALRMALVGTAANAQVAGRGPLSGVVSYFKGSDPGGWETGIPTFARVEYQDVYPGTDLLFRGTGEALEYDFLLAPGADPGRIALLFEGAEDLRLNEDGDLVIATAVGELIHQAPVVYQEARGERRQIPGAYRLHEDRVGFTLGPYDPTLPLVIDPVVLAYSTFLGGSGSDAGLDIAVDPYTRHAYVTGETFSSDFPTTAGAFDQTHDGLSDAFVTKVAPSGAALGFSTFLGGSGSDSGSGITVDQVGAAYVTGFTQDAEADFPTTVGTFDRTHNGEFDAFLTKLGPTGAVLSFSTFLGGSGVDSGSGIAVNGAGSAYVTGETENAATDFPTTTGAFDRSHNGGNDAFVAKLERTGASLEYSTFLGGSSFDIGFSITVDGVRAAYITGLTNATDFPTTAGAFDETHNGDSDAFVTKVSPTGAALGYSTFLGGSAPDGGSGIAVDGAGSAYITGLTNATDFPITAGAFDQTHNGDFDAFVTKLGPAGSAPLEYSTFLGGKGTDIGASIAVDAVRAAYVAGATNSTDFPTTAGAFDETHNGELDAFVTKLGPTGAAPLGYSTFLGGLGPDEGRGIAVNGEGVAHFTGLTLATDFPTTAGAFDQTQNGDVDAFVGKLVEPASPPPSGSAVACRGRTATLVGTVSDDSITGTPGRDVIVALGGRDLVKALGGSDVICAGRGHDAAAGGEGRDTIQGDEGRDRIRAGSANDRLHGGPGKDRCLGGSGQNVGHNCETERRIR